MDVSLIVSGGGGYDGTPFRALADGRYLHNMSKYDAYRTLNDAYGLRVTDEFKFANIRKVHSRLANEP